MSLVELSLDDEPLDESDELLSALDEPDELDDGPPSGEVPLGALLVGCGAVLDGGRGTVQVGSVVVVVVVVGIVDVVVEVVVEEVGDVVVVPHGGLVVVVVEELVDVGVVFVVVLVGFGALVVGVCLGGWLPSDGGPIANASVSGRTVSAGIGSTPRAYASAQARTVAT